MEKSIKTGHIHIATLFKVARENSYRPERPIPHLAPKRALNLNCPRKAGAEAERITQAHASGKNRLAFGKTPVLPTTNTSNPKQRLGIKRSRHERYPPKRIQAKSS